MTTPAQPVTTINAVDGSRNLYEECKVMTELSSLIYKVAILLETSGKGGQKEEQDWASWWQGSPPKRKQLQKLELVLSDECFNDPDKKVDEDGNYDLKSLNRDVDGDGTDDFFIEFKKNVSAIDFLEFIEANKNVLVKDEEDGVLQAAIESIKAHQESSYLWSFDQRFGGQGLVYAITVNRKLKRITVGFRGSVGSFTTGEDWLQNYKVQLSNLPTPGLLKDELGFDEEIKVHYGFREYLLDENRMNEPKMSLQEMKDEGVGKYGKILDDLYECYNYEENGKPIHKGFHLYVTGHSLGGALSSLLAMKLAASDTLRKEITLKEPIGPIVNISVASPYVGNESFANAVRLLEEKGWLRHIRITNYCDPVPVAPPKHFLWNKFESLYNEPYFQTGYNLHLKAKAENGLEHGFDKERGFFSQFPSFSPIAPHMVADYYKNMENAKDKLETMTIEGAYESLSSKPQ